VQLNAEVFTLMDRWIERFRRRFQERYERLDALLAAQPEATAPPRAVRARRTTR